MNTQEPDPPLPRKPEDLSQIRRLRQEALERMDAEQHPSPSAPYGGPAPVYGGPAFGGPVTRRWTLRRILILVFGLVATALAAGFAFWKRKPTPQIVIYGGPPIQPNPRENYPLYGGPKPPSPDDNLRLRPKPAPKPHRPTVVPGPNPAVVPPSPQPIAVKPAAAVYGGPVPPPQLLQHHNPAPVYGGPIPRPQPKPPIPPKKPTPPPTPAPDNPPAPPPNPAPQTPPAQDPQ